MTTKKTDKRANNGGEDKGLTEDRYLVQGPAKLIQGMRDLAESNGQTIAHVWRSAAQEYMQRRNSPNSRR